MFECLYMPVLVVQKSYKRGIYLKSGCKCINFVYSCVNLFDIFSNIAYIRPL